MRAAVASSYEPPVRPYVASPVMSPLGPDEALHEALALPSVADALPPWPALAPPRPLGPVLQTGPCPPRRPVGYLQGTTLVKTLCWHSTCYARARPLARISHAWSTETSNQSMQNGKNIGVSHISWPPRASSRDLPALPARAPCIHHCS